jgi:hypothetical protein
LPPEKVAPLFRTIGGAERQDRGQAAAARRLTMDRMTRQDARRMIVRRAKKARLLTHIGCPQLPRDRHHGLSPEWRPSQICPTNGGA